MDELEEIKKKKMEKMMTDMNKPTEPVVELPGKPIVVTDATLEKAAGQYPILILDCWAEWCGPCRMIGPIIEDFAKSFGIDAAPLLASEYTRIAATSNRPFASKYTWE